MQRTVEIRIKIET